MVMSTEERSLLAGWALGWGSLTLRNLRSNPDICMYEDKGATDILRDLSVWKQTPAHLVWAP